MASRLSIFESEHTAMVLARALSYLSDERFSEVRADCFGWEEPYLIGTHRPDVTAWHGAPWTGTLYIVEVETWDSITHAHTREQWEAFASYAAELGAVFEVVVPRSGLALAQVKALEWGVRVNLWAADPRF